jgi:hypothetical protein
VVVEVVGHTVVVVDVVVKHTEPLSTGVPKAAERIALTEVAAADPAGTAMITVLSSLM